MAKNSGQDRRFSRKTKKDAVAAGRKNSQKFDTRVDEFLANRKLKKSEGRMIDALMGRRRYVGQLRASDVGARNELRKQLIAHVDAFQRQNPEMRWFFITLLAEECDACKKRPILWLRRLKGKADKTLRELDIEGAVGMIEAQFIPYPPHTQLPVYSFHVHALAWARDDFDLVAAQTELARSGSWSNAWGIEPTNIKQITPEMGVAAWWAHYMTKLPVDATNVVTTTNGSVKFRSTEKGYRGDALFRLVEGLAQCFLADLFFGVKDGKHVRGPVWRATNAARKLAHPGRKPVNLGRVQALFRHFWRRSRADHPRGWFIVA